LIKKYKNILNEIDGELNKYYHDNILNFVYNVIYSNIFIYEFTSKHYKENIQSLCNFNSNVIEYEYHDYLVENFNHLNIKKNNNIKLIKRLIHKINILYDNYFELISQYNFF